ncbi:MAG: helix-turn-helix domain-containing protein [Sediminibacterium sp.]|uniref:helix-turn-helix domain-containing protein n=1 Tax=unclassified Sediminibacterium TaxID=2635961 RepID=UPI001D7D4454|nr:helix-turn-helix transcriptional regulator [Sediminibacterium sp.]MBW0159786.1 helix-turn-helix domain-containing protein [Sediminibacterium sp.]MBW0165246.1 helix-turn-helix domain-containing protein [Sediminibacterium sp.]
MAEISKIERYIIQKVKELRVANGMTQISLSQKLNMSDSFIGHVESPKRRDKYNLKHINALAKIFKCSPRDFLPEKPL